MKTHTTSLKAKLNSAFSLIELLVVIAVIAIIAAIAIPNITGIREAAQGAQESETSNNIVRLGRQALAAGYTGLTTDPAADLTNWQTALTTGIDVTVPGTTNVVSFKLQ